MCGICTGKLIMIIYTVLFICLALGWILGGALLKDRYDEARSKKVKAASYTLAFVSIGVSFFCVLNIFCSGRICTILCIAGVVGCIIGLVTCQSILVTMVKALVQTGIDKAAEANEKVAAEEASKHEKEQEANIIRDEGSYVDTTKEKEGIGKKVTHKLTQYAEKFLPYIFYCIFPLTLIIYSLPLVALVCRLCCG